MQALDVGGGRGWVRPAELANHRQPRELGRQEAPLRQPGVAVNITARIDRRTVVGGLISEYRRAA